MSEVITTTTTIASNTTDENSSSGTHHHPCPYAQAFSKEELSQSTSSDSSNAGTTTEGSTASAAVKSCPAFSSGSCPFKDAHSSQDVRETLLKIPPSHFDRNAEFFQVIQGLHKVTASSNDPDENGITNNNTSSSFQLPGGCPVQPILMANKNKMSFTEAMEEFSLSAVMARLAQEAEDAREQQQSKEEQVFAMHALALQEKLLLEQPKQQQPAKQEEEDGGVGVAVVVAKKEESEEQPVLPLPIQKLENDSETDNGGDNNNNKNDITTTTTTTHLSAALKSGTAASHQAAENVHFVSNFIKGKIDRKLYVQLVVMLYHVYQHLEECLDEHGPNQFATCHFPVFLNRRQALQEDLDYWCGSNNAANNTFPMSDATRDYCNRIRHIADTQPLLLLAHAYTRYLGDLSGGRILARVARRALDLGKDEGLAFYEFEKIESPKRFKDEYRAALDALPLTSRQVRELVAEANVAFILNMRLFEELDVQANFPGATVRPLSDALAYATLVDEEDEEHENGDNKHHGSTSSSGAQPSDKCPFAKMGATAQAAATTAASPSAPSSSGSTQPSDKCPFAAIGIPAQGATAATASPSTASTSKRCPWPFIILHDPVQGLRDWKTWVVLGLVLCWAWSLMTRMMVTK